MPRIHIAHTKEVSSGLVATQLSHWCNHHVGGNGADLYTSLNGENLGLAPTDLAIERTVRLWARGPCELELSPYLDYRADEATAIVSNDEASELEICLPASPDEQHRQLFDTLVSTDCHAATWFDADTSCPLRLIGCLWRSTAPNQLCRYGPLAHYSPPIARLLESSALSGLMSRGMAEILTDGSVRIDTGILHPGHAVLEDIFRVVSPLIEFNPTSKHNASAVRYGASFGTSHLATALETAEARLAAGRRLGLQEEVSRWRTELSRPET